MSEQMLTDELALSFVRRLSGTENYPFQHEGELRMAEVLTEYTAGVAHARLTVDEFEGERCPSIENLRAAAKRLAELCECGKARWAHRKGSTCKRFEGKAAAEEGWTKGADGSLSRFRQSIPQIPGVRWEVCMQIECIRINLGQCGSPPDQEALAQNERDFPQAVAALRAGQSPDYKQIEAVLSKRIPRWSGEKKKGEGPARMAAAAEALNEMDRGYQVSKEVDVA